MMTLSARRRDGNAVRPASSCRPFVVLTSLTTLLARQCRLLAVVKDVGLSADPSRVVMISTLSVSRSARCCDTDAVGHGAVLVMLSAQHRYANTLGLTS